MIVKTPFHVKDVCLPVSKLQRTFANLEHREHNY